MNWPKLIAGLFGFLALLKPSGQKATKATGPKRPNWAPEGPRRGALKAVTEAAHAQQLGLEFVAMMRGLAVSESGARYNKPANIWNGRTITAWGVFQWQDGHADTYFGLDHAWQMTEDQQTWKAVEIYADKIRGFPGHPLEAALLWHQTPKWYREGKKEGTVHPSGMSQKFKDRIAKGRKRTIAELDRMNATSIV